VNVSYEYKKGECPPPDFSREVIAGQKTGDIRCTGCAEVFAPSEPEHKKQRDDHEKRLRESAKKH
jgi:hypothetical protein